MGNSASLDDLFRAAVSAIDAGDIPELNRQLTAHPRLVSDRLETPGPWLRDKVGNALVNSGNKPQYAAIATYLREVDADRRTRSPRG